MKVDILIKSFNRPYYLDRCIKSICQYLEGDYQIKVLDDGTPEKYLDLIQKKYPEVSILSSPLAPVKRKLTEEYLTDKTVVLNKKIPGDFWYKEVEKSSSIFFLLEDDIWLVQPLNVKQVCQDMTKCAMVMLKASWLGNERLIAGKHLTVSDQTQEVMPTISLLTQTVVLNKYWVRSLLYRAGMLDGKGFEWTCQMPLYSLYTVASAFYLKDYWLYLWSDKQQSVNEHTQLTKAWRWYKDKDGRYGKTTVEITNTSFISSSFSDEKTGFDMLHFNSILNQLWYDEELDVMENFPKDFSENYICLWLKKAANPAATCDGWKEWTAGFKNQYSSLGCHVD